MREWFINGLRLPSSLQWKHMFVYAIDIIGGGSIHLVGAGLQYDGWDMEQRVGIYS